MIKFKAKKENHNTGTIQSFKDNFDAITSKSMADQLNARNINKQCALHPDSESIILVSTEPKIQFEIGSVCCDEFRKELNRFLENDK